MKKTHLFLLVGFVAVVWLAPALSWLMPLVFAPLLPLHLLLVSAFALLMLAMYLAPLVWARAFDRAEAQRARSRADEPTWAPITPAAGRELAVVLIHGTFARKSTWTAPEAPLPGAFGDAVTKVRFLWSDANSMRSRRIATEGLRRCILELVAQGYRHVAVVAHSHGGNIALKAAEDASIAQHVSAIVCMATPFISAWRPRTLVQRGVAARAGMLLASCFGGSALLLLPGSFAASPAEAGSPRVLLALAGAAVMALLLGAAAWRVARQLQLEPTEGGASGLHQDITGSVCDAKALTALCQRTLILTRGGDEADGVLKVASLLNRQVIGFVNQYNGVDATKPGTLQLQPSSVAEVFQSMAIGSAAFLAAVTSLAFGANGLRTPTGVFFTSAETPPGLWRHLNLSSEQTLDGAGLYHSSLYTDTEAVSVVKNWVLGLEGRGPPESQPPDAGSIRTA
jgi:Alpha/beta hydrolase family